MQSDFRRNFRCLNQLPSDRNLIPELPIRRKHRIGSEGKIEVPIRFDGHPRSKYCVKWASQLKIALHFYTLRCIRCDIHSRFDCHCHENDFLNNCLRVE